MKKKMKEKKVKEITSFTLGRQLLPLSLFLALYT